MNAAQTIPASIVLVAGVAIVIGSGCAVTAIILGYEFRVGPRRRRSALWDRERDLAAALGWSWRAWVALRVGVTVVGVAIAVWSGVWLLVILLGGFGAVGVRFAVAGHAARRRLRMERAFLAQLRVLRERMALAHQSLDTALQELGASPGKELGYVMAPLRRGGSVVENILECAERSRSPLIESAFAVLLWARTRSLDALIDAIDEVLLPVGHARMAIEEESLVTLTQQRAVIFAMAVLMALMLGSLLRVESFRRYYETPQGTLVLLGAIGLFSVLIALVSRIVRVSPWTRWDLRRMLQEGVRPHD